LVVAVSHTHWHKHDESINRESSIETWVRLLVQLPVAIAMVCFCVCIPDFFPCSFYLPTLASLYTGPLAMGIDEEQIDIRRDIVK